MKILTFSADDFGLTSAVNEAVELTHRNGVLNQASLMVAAPAAADAIARAKRLPDLKLGLHLVLVDGDSLLGHARLPTITGLDGRFGRDQIRRGFAYFFSGAARRELESEIQAQFSAFMRTGLVLHHADAHKHMHMHPVVAELMMRIGAEYGLKRIRVPAEPPNVLKACGETPGLAAHALYNWSRILRGMARRHGLVSADHVFGIGWSGHMTETRVRRLLAHLPDGSSEIYFHPATERDQALQALMPDYDHVAEFKALMALKAPPPQA
jgi:hopanoid biosynthesis associated protein HpnK